MLSLFIPVILGTARAGRRSEWAAYFVLEQVKRQEDVETELIDVKNFRLPATNDSRETPLVREYRKIIGRADALIVVSPEYSHGYPGELKMMLDMASDEYAKKPIAFCGVGGVMGGARAVEQLRLISIDLGAVPVAEAVYFAKIKELFDGSGQILDDAYSHRVAKMLDELVWYARALKQAREEKNQNYDRVL